MKVRKRSRGVSCSPTGLRLKERDVENGKKKTVMREKRESQQWENKDNACVCVVFVTVAFWRTEGLCVWVCVCVCVFASPSTQFVELICSLIVSKMKSQPNPTTIYNTDGRAEGLRDII